MTPAAAKGGRAFGVASGLLLLAVFGLDVYRAATQSVTHDEALTYFAYVDGPITRSFGPYMPNNHVLHSLLAWASVHALGLSELTLRLPAVLGALMYLACARRLCRRAFGGRWIALLALGLLCLNPLILDFQSAARGYSLALGFLLWALLRLLDAHERLASPEAGRPPGRSLALASFGIGASAASHLTFALPGACLALITAAVFLLHRPAQAVAPVAPGEPGEPVAPVTPGEPGRPRTKGARASGLRAVLALAVPAAVVAGALWLPSLAQGRPARIDYGLPTLLDSSENLVRVSLAHHATHWPLDTAGQAFRGVELILARIVVPVVMLALALCWLAAMARLAAARRLADGSAAQVLPLLAGGALILCLLTFVAAHHLVGALYPQDRWGLYLLLLFVLAATGLGARLWAAGGVRRAAGAPLLAVLWLVLAQNVVQLQVRQYLVWSFDAGNRELFGVIVARHAEDPAAPARLAAMHWTNIPSLNFYRALHGATWMPEVRRDFVEDESTFDYVLVRPGIHEEFAAAHLRTLASDPVSGVSLAVPRSR